MEKRLSNRIYSNSSMLLNHYVHVKSEISFHEVRHALLLADKDWTLKAIVRSDEYRRFANMLEASKKWLTGEIKDVFHTEENGDKIVSRRLENKMMLNGRELLFIKPSVIKDRFGVNYEGVTFYKQTGIIGNMTGQEFLVFEEIVHQFLSSAYSASVALGLYDGSSANPKYKSTK